MPRETRPAFAYRALIDNPQPFEETAPGRLMASMMNIQQRREAKARQEELDRVAAEERQRKATQEADDLAVKMFELQRQLAANTERDKAAIKFEERAKVGEDAAMIPDTPEERAAWEAGTPIMAKPDAPEITANVGGITLRAPALDRAEVLQQKLDEARKVAMAKGAAELTPEIIATMPEPLRPFFQPGQLVEPPNISSFLGAQARGTQNGKMVERTVDLGNQIEYIYSDGTRELKPKGAAPRAEGAGVDPTTGMDRLQNQNYMQITRAFESDPVIKQADKGASIASLADQIISDPSKATNQLKAMYVYVKNLDPDSAVRSEEQKLINLTESYWQKAGRMLESVYNGQVIHPDAARDVAIATKELIDTWRESANVRAARAQARASGAGVGKQFEDYLNQVRSNIEKLTPPQPPGGARVIPPGQPLPAGIRFVDPRKK